MTSTIKVQLVEMRPMTVQGMNKYSASKRGRMFPYTFHAQHSLGDIDVNELNSKQKITDFIWLNAGAGTWDLRSPCPNKKARLKSSMKTLVRVRLEEIDDTEYNVTLWKPMRLQRYTQKLQWKDKNVN